VKKRIEGIIIIAMVVLAGIGAFVFMGLDTPLLLVLLFLVMLGIGISVLLDGNRAINKSNAARTDNEVINSSKLHEEVNQELKQKGKSSIEAINTIGGVSTNNLARKDKSWNSVPDFFYKMIKGKR
jgi:uncharacterized membrane protein YfcA